MAQWPNFDICRRGEDSGSVEDSCIAEFQPFFAPDLGLPRAPASCKYQPWVWCGRNSQVPATRWFPADTHSQMSPVGPDAGTEGRIREILLDLQGSDFHTVLFNASPLF